MKDKKTVIKNRKPVVRGEKAIDGALQRLKVKDSVVSSRKKDNSPTGLVLGWGNWSNGGGSFPQ